MQKRILPVAVMATFILVAFGISCTKIDTTSLGTDLVTVDNINTFADTLLVNATEGNFVDSTILKKTDNYLIGRITTDNVFGTTDAAVYVSFKPTFYPFYFGNAGDTVNRNTALDSAFVCLSYKGTWGDTTTAGAIPQTFEVRAIETSDANFRDKFDTLRPLSYRPFVNPTVIGSANLTPSIMKSRVVLSRQGSDSVIVENQIRIKIDTAYANQIFRLQDSTAAGPSNALYNDSIFRRRFNGFEIRVRSNNAGNNIHYVNITEANSRLEFHFKKSKNGVRDTVLQSFQFYPTPAINISTSPSANYVSRDYTGTNVLNPNPNDIYLQTGPSTLGANIKIPGLTNYSNRIVHRAYLIVEQDRVGPLDDVFTAPPYLYLDIKDTATTIPQRYKPMYFDLSSSVSYNPDAAFNNALYHPYPIANVDLNTFGGAALRRTDNFGNSFYRYEFNITRYVQHIVTNGYKNYDLRLFAPYNYFYKQYLGDQYLIPFFNPIGLGRVKVGSGTHPTHPMRLVVIYSKIP